jgi:hypothetical protein
MPASIENDAEVVATRIDVCAVHYITTVFDGCAERYLGEVMGRRGGGEARGWIDEAEVGGAVGK